MKQVRLALFLIMATCMVAIATVFVWPYINPTPEAVRRAEAMRLDFGRQQVDQAVHMRAAVDEFCDTLHLTRDQCGRVQQHGVEIMKHGANAMGQ